MPRKKVESNISQRKEAGLRKETKETIATVLKAKKCLDNKLDAGKPLSDQELRFLEHYPEVLRTLRGQEVEEKEEILPEGKLKDYVNATYRIEKILRDNGLPKGLEGRYLVLDQYNYYKCDFCEFFHKKGEECMFKLMDKNIEVKKDEQDSQEDINL